MKLKFRHWLAASASIAVLSFAPAASADPASIAAAAVSALGVSGVAASVVTFAVSTAVGLAYSVAASKLMSVFQKQQARQASVLELTLGEHPREFLFGETVTGGNLIDGGNYGGKAETDNEVMVIGIADHLCHALVGYYLDDMYYPFLGDGAQEAGVGPAGGDNLWIYWRDGQESQLPPADEAEGIGWEADKECLAGIAHVWVRYRFNEKVWPQGRPKFKWLVRGARLYDPRKDGTVEGGAGPHRWDDPATHEFSENLQLARYAFVRGIYACGRQGVPDQLLIGRGLSELEAPPARVSEYANICDELVALKAGGFERRYSGAGLIRADETFQQVDEAFAAAMAGVIIKRDGGIEIEPGHAKAVPPELEFTDDDLVVGERIVWNEFEGTSSRRNAVVPRYIEPMMGWQNHAAPIRRDTDQILVDGKVEDESLDLIFVKSGTQAQRCAEIKRRLNMLEKTASVVLPPDYAMAEDGDWMGYTSERRMEGERRAFRVQSYSLNQGYRNTLALREIDAWAYGWIAAVDEHTPYAAPPVQGARGPLELEGVEAEPIALLGGGGSQFPAIGVEWDVPSLDPGIGFIKAEVRRVDPDTLEPIAGTTVASRIENDDLTNGASIIQQGVVGSAKMQVRLVPLGQPGRTSIASAWITIDTPEYIADTVVKLIDREVADVLADVDQARQEAQDALTRARDLLSQVNLTAEAVLERALEAFEIKEYVDAKTHMAGRSFGTLFTEEQEVREAADEILFTRSTTMGAWINDNQALILDKDKLYVGPLETLAQRLTLLQANDAANAANIIIEQNARIAADSATATQLTALTTTVTNNNTAINAALVIEAQTRSTQHDAQATLITGLQADMADAFAEIEDEKVTRSTADTALAAATTALSAVVGTKARVFRQNDAPGSGMVEGDIWIDSNDSYRTYVWVPGVGWQNTQILADTALANITLEHIAWTNADTALSSTIASNYAAIVNPSSGIIDARIATERVAWVAADSALSSTISNNYATIVNSGGVIDARVQVETNARVNGDSSLTSYINGLYGNIVNGGGIIDARVQAEAVQRINADGVIQAQINTLTSTVNGQTASITAQTALINDINGRMTSMWGVVIDLNGYVAGVQLIAQHGGGVSYSAFNVRADAFNVWNAGAGNVPAFSVIGGQVFIAGNRVNTQSITANAVTYSIAQSGAPNLTGTGFGTQHLVTSGTVNMVDAGMIDIDFSWTQDNNQAGQWRIRIYVNGGLYKTMTSARSQDVVAGSVMVSVGAGNHSVAVYYDANGAYTLKDYTLKAQGVVR